MRFRTGTVAVAAIVLAGLHAGPARAAATIYVDRDSRGGACSDQRIADEASSPDTPLCTLGWALRLAAVDETTIVVRAGDYPHLDLTAWRHTQLVTFRAYPGEQPTLAGIESVGVGHFHVEGFKFTSQTFLDQGGDDQAADIAFTDNEFVGAGIEALSPRDFSVEGNHFHDITLPGPDRPAPEGYALFINGESDNSDACCDHRGIDIRGNRFERIENDAIQLGGGANDALVEGNDFSEIRQAFGSHADSIQLVDAQRTIIRGNRIHDSDSALMMVHALNRDEVIENNVITDAGWACDCGNMPGSRFVNNTLWANTFGGISIQDDDPLGGLPPTTDLVIANNIAQSVELSAPMETMASFEDYNLIANGERIGAHDVSALPSFVAADDLHLAALSPGIDAGTSDYDAPITDFEGNARVDDPDVADSGGGATPFYDLGAYEHQPAAITPDAITIAAPVDGRVYRQGATVIADFTCAGAVKSCTGPVATGQPIETATVGTHAFTVTVEDQAGHTATKTVHYTVDGTPPAITVSSPVAGVSYQQGTSVVADFTCADASGVDTCTGTVADGQRIDTATSGEHTFVVTAEDSVGNTASASVRYVVAEPDTTAPAITVKTPVPNSRYERDADVRARFTCADEEGGSGVSTCAGTVDNGDPIDTSTLGRHHFSVTARDRAGNTRTVTVDYTVTASQRCELTAKRRGTARHRLKLAARPTAAPLSRVRFYVRGKRVRTDRRAPYTATWSVPRAVKGRRITVSVICDDTIGRTLRAKVRVRA